MKMRKHFTGALALVLAIGLAGCQSMPKDALMLGPESLANRQLQTRRFDGLGEKETLAAGAGVLQDLGFTITESKTSLGVVVGNKDRSAVNAGQIVGAVLVVSDRDVTLCSIDQWVSAIGEREKVLSLEFRLERL